MEERRLNTILPGQISDLPLREANTRGSAHITGVVYGRKFSIPLGRIAAHERQFIIRAELDPRVTRILYQPVWYEIPDGKGGVTSATPDFLIDIDGKLEIHEVKSDKEYDRSKVRDKIQMTARIAEKHGHRYSITLSSALHRETDEEAIFALWRVAGNNTPDEMVSAARRHLSSGPVTAGQLVWALKPFGATIHDVHTMLANGDLVADLTTNPDELMLVHGRDGAPVFDRLIPFTSPLGVTR